MKNARTRGSEREHAPNSTVIRPIRLICSENNDDRGQCNRVRFSNGEKIEAYLTRKYTRIEYGRMNAAFLRSLLGNQ